MAEDFDRFINGTMWDRVDSRPVSNVSPQMWQEYKSGLVKTAIYKRFRVKADNNSKAIYIDPTPTSSQCAYGCEDGVVTKLGITYEYISKNWAVDANNVRKADFTADTDTFMLDELLLEMDIKWRWLKRLELDFNTEYQEMQQFLEILKAQEGGAQVIAMDGTGGGLPYPNIPESGVGLS